MAWRQVLQLSDAAGNRFPRKILDGLTRNIEIWKTVGITGSVCETTLFAGNLFEKRLVGLIDRKFDEAQKNFNESFGRYERKVNQGFATMERGIRSLNEKTNQLGETISKVEVQFSRLEESVSRIKESVNNISDKVGVLEKSFEMTAQDSQKVLIDAILRKLEQAE